MLLIDTDVLIDVALDRKPHSDSACKLLDRLELRPRSALIAWHTASNFYYLVASKRGAADTGFISILGWSLKIRVAQAEPCNETDRPNQRG